MSATQPFRLHGSAILVIWGSMDGQSTTDEGALNEWWTNEHLPERLAIPGFFHARRYYGGNGSSRTTPSSSRYLVWYEVISVDTLTSPAYLAALDNPTESTARFMPTLASMNRSACRVLYSAARADFDRCPGQGPAGGTMVHLTCEPPPPPAASGPPSSASASSPTRSSLRRWIEHDLPATLQHDCPTWLAVHLAEHDEAATRAGSSSKSYEAVRFQQRQSQPQARPQPQQQQQERQQDRPSDTTLDRWILLFEFSEPLSAPFARHAKLMPSIVNELQDRGAKNVDCHAYQLVCAMNSS